MTSCLPNLAHAYAALTKRLPAELEIESLASAEVVMRHRQYWQPQQVRVVLFAESHLETSRSELLVKIDLSPYGHPTAPKEFARFVYCVGYGESEIADDLISQNTGTWQYWRLFASCAFGVATAAIWNSVLKGSTPDLATRIRNKLQVLTEMRRRGIWLVDSSLLAVCRPGGQRLSGKDTQTLLQTSWDFYWRDVLKELAPRHVICIGTGVHKLLGASVAAVATDVSMIEQPNAYLSGDLHLRNLQYCADVCNRFAP